ncbi:transforming growth factor beta receptor type 3 isoform X2 [Kryptolebias marmoratus]|uniref:transforming growth factor beta receptor type 3 isoform X2 n=1 Tax=Kryptolebias marmoratus TaxID=37003 RepID=UPI0018ACD81E|nr:transforming growth factor beta receptor type 3 isoform X2 [Kryptolebias marmoratus]
MAQRSHIPLALLAICCLTSAGPAYRSPCELLPVGTGHPVQAVQKSFTVMSGCASGGTVSLPQEVHVINLRGHAPQGFDNTPAQVELHLKPIQSMLHHHKPLVFVLNSPQPLVWNVKAENLELRNKHTFYVSQGSEVHFEQGNFSLFTQIQQETLPHGNEHLLNWAQKQYEAVTSFSELRMTQAIYIKVGEDSLLPDTCKIDTKFLSLNYLGSYQVPQASKGCILSVPERNREVHIVDLQAPNSSSAFQVDVIVDLKPLKNDGVVIRDITLLLKCAKSVHWVVKTHSVTGKLDVVASDSVSVSSQMSVSQSPKQSLPSGRQALIKWAEEHGYGPVTSYTNTPVANHFNIRLKEPDMVDRLKSRSLPDLSILHNSSPQPGDRLASRRSDPPFQFSPPLLEHFPSLPFGPDQSWGDEELENQRIILSVAFSLQCLDQKMVVSIDKKSLQEQGFTHANLTLEDPECKASINATYYTLETPLSGCRTTMFPMSDSLLTLYINNVIVTPAEMKDGSGGPVDSEDLESEDSPFPKDLVEPERILTEQKQQVSVIEFNCSYKTNKDILERPPGILPVAPRPPVNNMMFHMELYDTLPYNSSSRQAFYTVSQQKKVFVQITSTVSDPDVGFTITSCFISPNSNPRVSSDYELIQTVCPSDESVIFQKDFPLENTKRKIFSFVFNSKLNERHLYLHCEMSLCSKNSQNQALPQCLTCESVSSDKLVPLMMDIKVSTMSLTVVDRSHQTEQTEKPQDPTDDRTMYLLDTPTVMGIAFAAFVIGALLTGALWFIYSHTAWSWGVRSKVTSNKKHVHHLWSVGPATYKHQKWY